MITYDDIKDRAFLKDAAEKRAGDIEQVFGSNGGVELSWVLRTWAAPRELVLIAREGDRQAEEPISSAELIEGDGPFTDKLKRMKDALAHNGEWRVGVRDLIANAREWCKSLPNATTEDYTVALNEERSGKYTLPALRIRRAGRTLDMRPVAGWIVPPSWLDKSTQTGGEQAVGRVDLDGTSRMVPIYLLSPSRNWIYQAQLLYPDSAPVLFGILDQVAFSRLVAECMDD